MMRALKIVNRTTADVAVIGAGTAGVFAAIAAAKSGAKTVLVEKNSSLGGTVTTAGVSFPGLSHGAGKLFPDHAGRRYKEPPPWAVQKYRGYSSGRSAIGKNKSA